MKYIRTYETEEKFLTDKDSTSRGFRLKPTLYKYSDAGDHVHLELDDPRKHGDSTYMEITLDSDVEFSLYIGNAPNDTQTTMTCSIDWGDGTVETKVITKDDKGFKLSHNYTAGSYKIELYGVERDYSVIGDTATASGEPETWKCLISHPSSVKRVVLGGNVVSIGTFAFTRCHSLVSIYIPNSVTSIGANVFGGCTALTSVYISNNITSIEELMFIDCISLTSVYIPESVTSIGIGAFWGCKSLKSINIHESVTSIEIGVFSHCTSLSSIYIPESVTSIGESAFMYCTSLTSINIPEGVTIIKFDTFKGCSSLTSIYIPERVTSIEYGVFNDCISLKSISSFNTTAPTLSTTNSEGNLVGVFTNLPANGTLHIKPGATGYDAWLSKLPSGWTIVEDL